MWRILGLAALAAAAAAAPTRVLFVGNSFTYVNDLPHQFQAVAASMGKEVEVANRTIGGCTLYHLQPDTDATTAALLERDWDYIVLQDYSALATVARAREVYMKPAVNAFLAKKKQAKVVMYLTWAYHNGSPSACPSSDNGPCFPLGKLDELTEPSCKESSDYHDRTGSFGCMGYSLARGYLDAFALGVDRVAPCGVAWQVVRGLDAIDDACTGAIDAEYAAPMPAPLPLPTDKSLAGTNLYIKILGSYDKHPNVAGQYLNALTFYATIFGESPVGAAGPQRAGALTPAEVAGFQKVAEDVVLGHRAIWRV